MNREVTPTTLLRTAREYNEALSVLLDSKSKPFAKVICLLAGHSVEVGLKAFLMHAGWDERRLKNNVNHNLVRAWNCAHTEGLGIAETPPLWCTTLSSAHDVPFLNRYPKTNVALVINDMRKLSRHIDELLTVIEAEIAHRTNRTQ